MSPTDSANRCRGHRPISTISFAIPIPANTQNTAARKMSLVLRGIVRQRMGALPSVLECPCLLVKGGIASSRQWGAAEPPFRLDCIRPAHPRVRINEGSGNSEPGLGHGNPIPAQSKSPGASTSFTSRTTPSCKANFSPDFPKCMRTPAPETLFLGASTAGTEKPAKR